MKKPLLCALAFFIAWPLPAQDPGKKITNPAAEPVAVPIYELSRTEKKLYDKMLRERQKLERDYPLVVTVESTHATSYEAPRILGQIFIGYGNYNFLGFVGLPLVDFGRSTVELKTSAPWHNGGKTFSLHCYGTAVGNCIELPSGQYLARRTQRGDGPHRDLVDQLEIPLLVRTSTYIGGIYAVKKVKLRYDIRAFDENRLLK